jgi:hypothetical protein
MEHDLPSGEVTTKIPGFENPVITGSNIHVSKTELFNFSGMWNGGSFIEPSITS